MGKSYKYDLEDTLVNRYEVSSQIRHDHTGEYYQVNDIYYDGDIYDLHLVRTTGIPIEHIKRVQEYLTSATRLPEEAIKPVNFGYDEKESFFFFIYPEDALLNIVSTSDYQMLSKENKLSIFSDIVGEVKALSNGKHYHSFISPYSITHFRGKYRLTLYGVGWLILPLFREIKSNEIQFFAPEVLKSGSFSEKADIWSLGILASYLHSGKGPFEDDSYSVIESMIDSPTIPSIKKERILSALRGLISNILSPTSSGRAKPSLMAKAIRQSQRNNRSRSKSKEDDLTISSEEDISAEEFNFIDENEGDEPEVSEIEFNFDDDADVHHSDKDPEQKSGDDHNDVPETPNKGTHYDSHQAYASGNWYETGFTPNKCLPKEKLNAVITLRSLYIDESSKKKLLQIRVLPIVGSASVNTINVKPLIVRVYPKPEFLIHSAQYHILPKLEKGKTQAELSIRLYLRKSACIITAIRFSEQAQVGSIECSEIHRFLDATRSDVLINIVIKFTDINPELKLRSEKLFLKLKNRPDEFPLDVIIEPRSPAYLILAPSFESTIQLPAGIKKVVKCTLKNEGKEIATGISISFPDGDKVCACPVESFHDIEPGLDARFNIYIDSHKAPKGFQKSYNIYIDYNSRDESGNTLVMKRVFKKINILITESGAVDFAAIDFGTSNSCISLTSIGEAAPVSFCFENEGIRPNAIASSIYYEKKTGKLDCIIGEEAKNRYLMLNHNSFLAMKKYIGSQKSELLVFESENKVQTYDEMVIDYMSGLLDLVRNEYSLIRKFIFTHPTLYRLDKLKRERFQRLVHSLVGNNGSEVIFIDEANAAIAGILQSPELKDRISNTKSYILVYDFGGGTTDIVFSEVKRDVLNHAILGVSYSEISLETLFIDAFDYGGENVNLDIISIIRKTIHNVFGLIVPFTHPSEKAERRDYIKHHFPAAEDNPILLWRFAEKFKIDLHQIVHESVPEVWLKEFEELVLKLSYCKNGSFDDYSSWASSLTPSEAKDEISRRTNNATDFYGTMLGNVADQVARQLCNFIGTGVHKLLQKSDHYIEDSTNFYFLPAGNSCRMQLVQEIFKQVISNNSDESIVAEVVQGFNFRADVQPELYIPDELKSIVANGAILIGQDKIKIEGVLKNFANYGFQNSNDADSILIRRGKHKLPSTPEDAIAKLLEDYRLGNEMYDQEIVRRIEPECNSKYAAYCKIFLAPKREASNIKIPISTKNDVGYDIAYYGKMEANFGALREGTEYGLTLYISENDQLLWVVMGLDGSVVMQGEIT